MARVEIDRVRKSYGKVNVLHDISVEAPDGEFVVLVGPSGCGKSTLLRMIAGLETVSGGEIRIGGKRANDVQPKHRNIAMVFQSYALYPHMTVAQNMAFSLEQSRFSRVVIAEKVQATAKILGLETYLGRRPKELSGGQRQRVAMGRAIVRDPSVFLFDEPLSNLDAQLRVTMRDEIKALQERLGTTTIYVTHDQIEAMTMADRIVVMNQGRVEQIGAPLELYDRPKNLFVARFIGSPTMNLVEGTVHSDGSSPVLRSKAGASIRLPASLQVASGADVVLGFRPEHLRVAHANGDIVARVSRIQQTGAETYMVLDLGSLSISITLHDRVNVTPGEQIHLTMQPDCLHLFDHGSGRRI